MKIDLPGENWAVLRDVEDMNGGDKLAVLRATYWPIPTESNPEPRINAATNVEPKLALLARLITEWSYPGWPIPSMALDSNAALEQLSVPALNKLLDAADPYMEAINNPSS